MAGGLARQTGGGFGVPRLFALALGLLVLLCGISIVHPASGMRAQADPEGSGDQPCPSPAPPQPQGLTLQVACRDQNGYGRSYVIPLPPGWQAPAICRQYEAGELGDDPEGAAEAQGINDIVDYCGWQYQRLGPQGALGYWAAACHAYADDRPDDFYCFMATLYGGGQSVAYAPGQPLQGYVSNTPDEQSGSGQPGQGFVIAPPPPNLLPTGAGAAAAAEEAAGGATGGLLGQCLQAVANACTTLTGSLAAGCVGAIVLTLTCQLPAGETQQGGGGGTGTQTQSGPQTQTSGGGQPPEVTQNSGRADCDNTPPLPGPYSRLADPAGVGPGQSFTDDQKVQVILANWIRWGSQRFGKSLVVYSDLTGTPMLYDPMNKKFITDADMGIEAGVEGGQVDHICPQSLGGTNSYSNAQLHTQSENASKNNVWPYPQATPDYFPSREPLPQELIDAFGGS